MSDETKYLERIEGPIPAGGLYLTDIGLYIADDSVPLPARLTIVRPNMEEMESACATVGGAVPPDGVFIEPLNAYITGVGEIVSHIHAENSGCAERGCSVHSPSAHNMRSFATHWRGDRGLMERICAHGIGHPDPDHMSFLRSLVEAEAITESQASAEGVHGCDGCCGGHPEVADQNAEADLQAGEGE